MLKEIPTEANVKHKFKKLLVEMESIFLERNRQYGQAWCQSRLGIQSLLVQIESKFMRATELTADEKSQRNLYDIVQDTFIDLAVYSLLALMYVDYKTDEPRETLVKESANEDSSPSPS